MISSLMIIICILSVISKNPAALAYALFAVAHDFIGLDGWQYYLSASLADVAVLVIISMSINPSRTTTGILYISFLSVIMNFYGYILWTNYLEPTTYNASFYMIYAMAIFVIARGDSAKLKGSGNRCIVPHADNKVDIMYRSLPEEARN